MVNVVIRFDTLELLRDVGTSAIETGINGRFDKGFLTVEDAMTERIRSRQEFRGRTESGVFKRKNMEERRV